MNKYNKPLLILTLCCTFFSGCTTCNVKHYSNSHILGKWESDYSTFTFKENSEFSEVIKKVEEGRKKNYYGEYVVVESGIFIRYYGSMHWPQEGKDKDYNTSIGAMYLSFSEPHFLVDNQEDYQNVWEKDYPGKVKVTQDEDMD